MIKLIQGDCIDKMRDIPDKSIDMILCDLPYGITALNWDMPIPLDKLWEQYRRICIGNIVLFCSQPFTTNLILSNIKMFKYDLVWSKNVPTGMSTAKYRPMRYHENIVVFNNKGAIYNPIKKSRIGIGKSCYNYDHYCGYSNHIKYKKIKKKYDPDFVQPSTVLNFNVVPNRRGKLHPTQKPVDLCEYLINTYSNINSLILDNCMGSGTTGIACINTNRNFIGIELEETYFRIAQKRILEALEAKDKHDRC